MKVLHINQSDQVGGAARAAYRIHNLILKNGFKDNIFSEMRVVNKKSDDPTVYVDKPIIKSYLKSKIVALLNKFLRLNFKPVFNILHSTAYVRTNFVKKINSHFLEDKGIVHLHWLGDNTISIEEINKIKQPLVWTLHDQWAFCGAEHYVYLFSDKSHENFDRRYIEGYRFTNRPTNEKGFDINTKTWDRKKRSWTKKMHIVCPSNWMANCARESYLMKNFPIHVIPNPIDLNIWKPESKIESRKKFNLPIDDLILLFGAVGGTNDKRKGADLLLKALDILFVESDENTFSKLKLVIFGQDHSNEIANKYKFPIHFVGKINEDKILRYLYSSADLYVLPSRQDNFPQTATEAHACGTPIVGFASGGLLDIVDENITGCLAKPFDPKSLAEKINTILKDKVALKKMGKAARKKALLEWSDKTIYSKYQQIYKDIV